MAIRIHGNYTNNTAIAPTNAGMGKIAQARLDNTVARANKKHQESLKVDGDHLLIWRREQTGFVCTCSVPKQTESFFGGDLKTNEIKLPPNTSKNMKVVTIRDGDRVTDYSGTPFLPPVTNDFNDSKINAPNNALLNKIQDSITDEELALYGGNKLGSLFGGDKHACGICFTTGWTQGYSLINGQRICLDASGAYPYNLKGVDLDVDTYPFTFRFAVNNTYVQWKISLPAYVTAWLSLSVRNNLKAARDVDIQYSTDEINWLPLSLEVLNSTNKTNRNWFIRVVKSNTLFMQDSVFFTHVEITFISSDNVISQLPQINFPFTFETQESVINTTIELDSTFGIIPKESAIYDSKYQKIWKVLDVAPKTTSSGQIFAMDLQVRSIHSSEALYSLNIIKDNYNPSDYRNLEQVQGGVYVRYSNSPNGINLVTYPNEAFEVILEQSRIPTITQDSLNYQILNSEEALNLMLIEFDSEDMITEENEEMILED